MNFQVTTNSSMALQQEETSNSCSKQLYELIASELLRAVTTTQLKVSIY